MFENLAQKHMVHVFFKAKIRLWTEHIFLQINK